MENGVCYKESQSGGFDIRSSEGSESSPADHLVVMVNGILGSTTDWKFAAEQFVSNFPDKVFVHCSERNVSWLTLDGVDVMGERLAQEVVEVIKRKPNLKKISFISHSVGGLVARYAVGILYRPPRKEKSGSFLNIHEHDTDYTISGLEAMNFITVATPHLGSGGSKQVPFLFGLTALEKAASCLIHLILGRTGRHLFLTDYDGGKPPLLKRIIGDAYECYFLSALHSFKRRVVYSNVDYDYIVGWETSSIRLSSELPPKCEDTVKNKYPHIVNEEYCKASVSTHFEASSTENHGSDRLEKELVTGLSRVSWEKVDVSFHSSRQNFAAHSLIQVKDQRTQIEGADVIYHMVDHFLA